MYIWLLQRALKNAGDRLKSSQKESTATFRGLEARVAEAESALKAGPGMQCVPRHKSPFKLSVRVTCHPYFLETGGLFT
jgi:hypothetical protein